MSNETKIWAYLKANTSWTDEGIAGLMGNLQAESALRPDNAQDSYASAYGTDADYVRMVDSGEWSADRFRTDAIGFGLAQWTYGARKAALLSYAKAQGKSIADLEMQLSFLIKEMADSYPAVNSTLRAGKDIRAASNAVLFQFENPANKSTQVQLARAAYGQAIYNRNHGTTEQAQASSTLIQEIKEKCEQLRELIKQLEG